MRTTLEGSKICYLSIPELSVPNVEKLSIALTIEQVTAIRAAVDRGEYATSSEVVREAMRDWQVKRGPQQEDINCLRKLWDEGIASGSAGKVDFVELRAEARTRLQVTKSASKHAG